MHKRIIYTEKAPKPIGPYSQAICVDGWLFISGQIPIDPSTGALVVESFEKQVVRVLENLKAIVEAAGGTLSDVVKVTVFLRDLTRFEEFNRVYSKYFEGVFPARSVVEVKNLPRNVDVEIEAVAKLDRCP